MSAFNVVIPARYAAARLPGKPLLDIGGCAMVVRVAEQATAAGAEAVVVATDDQRILRTVSAAGHRAVMTDPGHRSGSDRVCEVMDMEGWPGDSILINLQGDEPLTPPALIVQLARALTEAPQVGMASLCEPIHSRDDLHNPNVVKVVRNRKGFALYFSRSPIPMAREGYPQELGGVWRRHIGIYGFRGAALRRFVAMPLSPLEALERLEQLRALDNGQDILMLDACQRAPGGVDTPADLRRVRRQFRVQAISATS